MEPQDVRELLKKWDFEFLKEASVEPKLGGGATVEIPLLANYDEEKYIGIIQEIQQPDAFVSSVGYRLFTALQAVLDQGSFQARSKLFVLIADENDLSSLSKIVRWMKNYAASVDWLITDGEVLIGSNINQLHKDYAIGLQQEDRGESTFRAEASNLRFTDNDLLLTKILLLHQSEEFSPKPYIPPELQEETGQITINNPIDLSEVAGVSPPKAYEWARALENDGNLTSRTQVDFTIPDPARILDMFAEEGFGFPWELEKGLGEYKGFVLKGVGDDPFGQIVKNLTTLEEDTLNKLTLSGPEVMQDELSDSSLNGNYPILVPFLGEDMNWKKLETTMKLQPTDKYQDADLIFYPSDSPNALRKCRICDEGVCKADPVQLYLDTINHPDIKNEKVKDFLEETVSVNLIDNPGLF